MTDEAGPERGDDTILVVDGVSRSFGGVHAVDNATFSVARSTVTGLIGPNGAGKSTMCNLIAGALSPDAGSIRYEGRDVAGGPPHRLAAMGLLRTFQVSSEFRRLTVTENLLTAIRGQRGASLGGALRGRRHWAGEERRNIERVRVTLDEFGLTRIADQVAGELSGGQKRLLEMMRALVARPRMLLLDEPIAGVHPTMVEAVIGAIERVRIEGITTLMIEHDLSVVERVCDHVIVMANGTVIADGRMEALRQNQEVVDAYFQG
jgi:ABC-type branched-subunit amino acid transport system ATPase component